MGNFSFFAQYLQNPDLILWLVVKILFVIGLGLYLAFPLLVLRQLKAFDHILGFSVFDLPIKVIAWVHLAIAIFVFLLSLIIL